MLKDLFLAHGILPDHYHYKMVCANLGNGERKRGALSGLKKTMQRLYSLDLMFLSVILLLFNCFKFSN